MTQLSGLEYGVFFSLFVFCFKLSQVFPMCSQVWEPSFQSRDLTLGVCSWLKTQKFIISEFEARSLSWSGSRAMLPLKALVENLSFPLSAPDGYNFSLACGHITPICASVFTWPSPPTQKQQMNRCIRQNVGAWGSMELWCSQGMLPSRYLDVSTNPEAPSLQF